jgi:hypothetical protein
MDAFRQRLDGLQAYSARLFSKHFQKAVSASIRYLADLPWFEDGKITAS